MSRIIDIILAIVFRVVHFGFQTILVAVYGKKQGVLPPINNSILTESATNLAQQIRKKQVKSEDVVKSYISRIRVVNPIINAMVEDRFLSALDEAREVDKMLATSTKTEEEIAKDTPFLGVPITTKNGIGIKGLIIDVGIEYKKGRRAVADSVAIKRMRDAGAIPLCVTNVPELCMWLDSANKIYGRTLNPYDLTRIPGGSSGGEGAIISAAGSVIGIGNDIAGSIRSPSFCCGIFGHKPTPLVVPQDGQFPSSHDNELKHYVSTGPMCRYAEDLKPILKCLAGENSTQLDLDKKINIKDIKVFYTDEFIRAPFITPISGDMGAATLNVVGKLHKNLGMEVHRINIPSFNKAPDLWFTKLGTAKAPPMEDFLTDGRYTINPYWELFKWFFRMSNHTFYIIFFLIAYRYHPAVHSEKTISTNLKIADDLKQHLVNLLGKDGVLIYPSHPEVAIFHQEQLAKINNWSYMNIFNTLGFPVTQCPVGLNEDGLPLGVQVVAAPLMDRLTLEVAQHIETEFGGWREPN